jgi:hypothetical protein
MFDFLKYVLFLGLDMQALARFLQRERTVKITNLERCFYGKQRSGVFLFTETSSGSYRRHSAVPLRREYVLLFDK